MYTIGFDVAKHEIVGALLAGNGALKERFAFPNTAPGIAAFLDERQERFRAGCEATAEYHNELALACIRRAIPFRVLNPIVTKQFTRATVRKRKTDRSDAEIIARCLLQGLGAQVSEASFSAAKRLLRTSADVMRIASAIGRMRAAFEAHWEAEGTARHILADLERAVAGAAERIRVEGVRKSDLRIVALLRTISGIGQSLAPVLSAEIGDISRFRNAKALSAYAGLDPRVKQSGASLKHNTRLTKRGSPHLRRALFLAASVAQRHDPELKAYYLKKRGEGKRYREATIANARHLLSRIAAVWKRGTPYVIHTAALAP